MSTTEHTESESASTPDTSAAGTHNLKSHACVLCQRRKVKCDKREPCANCTKARTDCVFRAPTTQRRRPRKSPEAILLARCRRYEELLRGAGVKIESSAAGPDVAQRVENLTINESDQTIKSLGNPSPQSVVLGKGVRPAAERGQIVVKNGKTRYLENKLWTHLDDEFMDASEILPGSSDEEDTETSPASTAAHMDPHGLLLGYSPIDQDLRSEHPPPIQQFRLWQAFLDNVHPMTKFIHAPTVQQALLEATEAMDDIPRPMESLMFAIYSCAVYSMSNVECEKITGQAKSVVLTRYQCAARHALTNAGLLKTSNITVLQAFALFLLSMRQRYDSHSLFILTGVALRISQRLGLHRDGLDLKLPAFETEMRRRLWWQVLLLEARAGEFSGVGQVILPYIQWTTKMPLNINDSSLHPSMVELPTDQDGASEMIHCLIRYEVGNAMRAGAKSSLNGTWQHFSSSEIPVKDKEKAIQGLEELLQRRFLQYCDASIPLHFVSAILASQTICKMRFRAYHPRHYWARTESVTQEEKEMLFSTCVKILELDNIVQSDKCSSQYLWHVNGHFQFDALIHVLSELRSRVTGENSYQAWQQVDRVFQHHPDFLTGTKRGLHVAISRLAVRAWRGYEQHASQTHGSLYQVQSTPFREVLASQISSDIVGEFTEAAGKVRAVDQDQSAAISTESMVDALGPPFDFNTPLMDSGSMDWSKWDDLVQDFEMNPTTPF
ncbi:transcription factor vrtR1 [Physcia stellaris]|nr:transcription factor vrtR1 [Physcia stellaris]